MAPLSNAMAGLLLPRDSSGTHLDGSANTVDDELEKKNFQADGWQWRWRHLQK